MLNDILPKRGAFLFDGGMGTALIEAGMEAGTRSESMNIKDPALVERIHRAYIAAGCDAISANTFGANPVQGGGADSEGALLAGMRIAKRAAEGGGVGGKPVRVALDIGPLGEMIGYIGDLSHEDARGIFADMARAGEQAGADFALIETMSDIEEMKDALWAVKAHTALPAICSMTFEAGGRTFMGVAPADFAKEAIAGGADAIGANCSLSPQEMIPIARALLDAAGGLPVLVQPNAGRPKLRGGKTVYEMAPDQFASGMMEMVGMGARMAGGCCGSTPEMIARLHAMLAEGQKA